MIRYKYSPYGGAEVFLRRFMAELRRRGHTLEVFSTEWPEGPGVAVHRVRVMGPSFLKPLCFAHNAARLVDKVRPDCVISLERTYCQDIYRAGDGCHREWLMRRGLTVSPLKRLIIRLNPLHAVLLHLEKRMFSDARLKKVAANSAMVKADIIRHYGLPEKRICVIYNGLDAPAVNAGKRAEIRRSLGIPDSALLLLFVGSGFERKGLMTAVRGLGLLRDKGDIRLLVIGKGRPAKYLREAARLGVGDRVAFKGPVAGAAEYYQAGDIFVLPSIYEPFSNACLEAMAAGLPVITSKANGAAEILSPAGYNAVIDDPMDAAGLAERVLALTDNGVRAKAGDAAREIAARYTIERNVAAFLELMEGIS
ncbi:MAG: glycosyltransferase family 4 protein [Deltaproteobacteria bacterium]|nr:glycosyltransferase family 4 protein [Deltaproteobacteria bacterium]